MMLIDRLQYMLNGEGYIYEHPPKLWLADVASGAVRRLTRGASRDEAPVFSPNGREIAFTSNRHPDPDLTWRTDIYVVGVDGGPVRRVTGGRGDRIFAHASWSPDGRWLAAIGHRYPALGGSRSDVWRFRADDGAEGENLTAAADLETSASMNSDLFGFAATRPAWSSDGKRLTFAAPVEGSYELWRVTVRDRAVERLTRDEHYLSRARAADLPDGSLRLAALRADAVNPPDVVVIDVPPAAVGGRAGLKVRRVTELMADAWGDV